ncbi:hypothetical protein [Streptomyces sp. NPDC058632]|uniref:hypothetical protein n=1 Tax=Streptomyces sp. NPDC058632 TaxID=3346567 RepID=UPI00364C8AA4
MPVRRAAHTLGLLDEVLNGVLHEGEHAIQDGETRGKVNVEIVLDTPGHVRLDRPDAEIIDRTVALQGLAGRGVRLLTCNTSQHTRGRAAGLQVAKVAMKDPGTSRTGRPRTGLALTYARSGAPDRSKPRLRRQLRIEHHGSNTALHATWW